VAIQKTQGRAIRSFSGLLRYARNDGVKISPDLRLSYSGMMIRAALIAIFAATPAFAQVENDCGACTELDRATIADPVTPPVLPALPKPASLPDRGQAIDLSIPGVNTPTVFFKPGSGLWVSDATPGGVYVKPKKDKFSIDLRF
jgi:hypothetical protein